MTTHSLLSTQPESPKPDHDPFFTAITNALGRKDLYTQGHGRRVATYSARLAHRLELAEEEIHNIALGGMLHDVGKLELNDQLFRNHCKSLSEEMWEEVYSHPLIGAALLDQVHCQNTIFEAVLFHHERMDGSGYPFGFKGEQIPISARIVGVADCFDAITTDRPYQRKKDCTHAFRILNGMAGACLDAELVPHFIEEIIESGIVASDDTAPAEA